ncbi:hypothetical protein D3C85_1855010 [compost metagenome]
MVEAGHPDFAGIELRTRQVDHRLHQIARYAVAAGSWGHHDIAQCTDTVVFGLIEIGKGQYCAVALHHG